MRIADGQDFWTHGVTGLPDIAFRLNGGVSGLIQNRVQEKIFIFRPCFIAPPNLPADFYEKNKIDCKKLLPDDW